MTDLTFPVLIDEANDLYVMGEPDHREPFFVIPRSCILRDPYLLVHVDGRDRFVRVLMDYDVCVGGTTVTVTHYDRCVGL